MEHLHRNISGTGWIIQDRATGKKVQGLLVEWSAAAESCAFFLLVMEAYYRAFIKEQTGNTVSCNNMGALHMFAKNST